MSRIGGVFRRRKLERDLADEMVSHFEEKIDELVESGMSREEAVFEAKRRIGNRTFLLEQGHEVWSFSPMENLVRDLRFGMRSLAKSPLFTWMSALILALGIGAN